MWPIVFIVLLALTIALSLYAKRRRYRLPPGPKGLPIFGNAFDIFAQHEWLTYAKWSRDYGEPRPLATYINPFKPLQALISST